MESYEAANFKQLGIPGLAEDMLLNQNNHSFNEGMLRPKLYKYICETLRLTERGFARKLSVSPATVTQWLYTDRMPRASVLARMTSTLNLSYDDIMNLFAT